MPLETTVEACPSYLARYVADYREAKAWFDLHASGLPMAVLVSVAAGIGQTELALRTVYAPTTV